MQLGSIVGFDVYCAAKEFQPHHHTEMIYISSSASPVAINSILFLKDSR